MNDWVWLPYSVLQNGLNVKYDALDLVDLSQMPNMYCEDEVAKT